MERRAYLAVVAGAAATMAGCGGGGSEDDEDWFSNVDNDDGEVDRTGESEAIRVDAGTTVVWEWTGQGGRHNVVDRDGAFASPYHEDAGATFQHSFDDTGPFLYYCEPHRAMGMRGGVRVE